LAPGETGVVLVISRDQCVAKVILNYIEGILRSSKLLAGLVANCTADSIELTNGISIEVRPANYRTLRGPTMSPSPATSGLAKSTLVNQWQSP
jgi:hypothetical protein